MAANPAVTCANSNVVDEALRKRDFLAVTDIFMTPTAELADIVLPACTFLEKTRYATYSTHADHSWNARSRIVFSPKVVEFLGGILRSILKMTKFKHYPEMYRKYEGFMEGFFTQSKNVELYSERLEELGYDPLPVYKEPAESPVSRPDIANEYPLILILTMKL